jgi:hypothetical protein
MFTLDMTMQIWPPHASNIALLIRTIISQQNDSVFIDIIVFIFDTQICVGPR